jgi:hypothetical protein
MAQPAVITIQPALFPLVPFRTTFATTPLPRRIRIIVPKNSDIQGDIVFSFGRDFVDGMKRLQ